MLRPLPLEAADVAAPAGFQIVIRDPERFRGAGFIPVYRLARALERREGVEVVRSIATFVPEASAQQAQNFFLSPLGAEPSEGLVAGTELTWRALANTPTPRNASKLSLSLDYLPEEQERR